VACGTAMAGVGESSGAAGGSEGGNSSVMVLAGTATGANRSTGESKERLSERNNAAPISTRPELGRSRFLGLGGGGLIFGAGGAGGAKRFGAGGTLSIGSRWISSESGDAAESSSSTGTSTSSSSWGTANTEPSSIDTREVRGLEEGGLSFSRIAWLFVHSVVGSPSRSAGFEGLDGFSLGSVGSGVFAALLFPGAGLTVESESI